jgi:hypothetical protein
MNTSVVPTARKAHLMRHQRHALARQLLDYLELCPFGTASIPARIISEV